MRPTVRHCVFGVTLLCTLVARPGRAQIPETFTNLQVLPKDISRVELVLTMRSFASALGVRCVHCHAGKDTPNLEGVDFASDERETKRAAEAQTRACGPRLLGREPDDERFPRRVPALILAVQVLLVRGSVDAE